MLILARKNHERIIVGDSRTPGPVITVTVLDIRGGTVKLGFETNREVRILRSELLERDRFAGDAKESISIANTPMKRRRVNPTERKYVVA